MITAGGLKKGRWVKNEYPGQTFEQLLSEIYHKDWYVWIDRVKGDGTFAFIYLGRYAKRACVSQKGIIEYRKGKVVVWNYQLVAKSFDTS